MFLVEGLLKGMCKVFKVLRIKGGLHDLQDLRIKGGLHDLQIVYHDYKLFGHDSAPRART